MDNKELFQKVKDLNLPLGEYAIFGSGPMGIRGIREMNDIDIIVTQKLWNIFTGNSEWELRQGNGSYGLANRHLGIETWKDWGPGWDVEKLIQEAEIINDLPFVKLEKMIKWKKISGRDKDLKDLELIKDWKKQNEKSSPG